MKNILKKILGNWTIILVLVSAILAGRHLLTPGYFIMHDDLQMMRQLEMEKCFKDGQIPCRWIPDMGYGFGYPLFNYYPPLPYWIGMLVRVIGFSFVDTVKIVFLISIIASGMSMYVLAKEFFGKYGGTLSAIFYIWAPYHSVDVFVRGAMNEAWALAFFPLILWTSYKLLKEKKKMVLWVIGLGLSWAGLLLSHNLMTMIFVPVFAVWCFLFWFKDKNWKKVWALLTSGILAAGLAAFFTLPAILEQSYVHVGTLISDYYVYVGHFATINQLLFSRFWGYGASIWGEQDGMPFQVGHVHWILSLFITAILLFGIIKKKKLDRSLLFIFFFILTGWLAAFMIHSRSTFIWIQIPVLKFVQFPWRFLALNILAFSFIAGSIFILLPKKLAKILSIVLVLTLVILNWGYFAPLHGRMGPLTDKDKFAGASWELQQAGGILDYLPSAARFNPREPQKGLTEVMTGKAEITDMGQGTNWGSFATTVKSDKATFRIGIFEFPDWVISVDGKEVDTYVPETEEWGRMYVDIPKGEHKVYIKLKNTPLRTAANSISLVTWLGLISFPIWRKKLSI